VELNKKSSEKGEKRLFTLPVLAALFVHFKVLGFWIDVGTSQPTLTVGDKEIGHGWSLFPHIFHGERSELREKY
jgi:hypothetical protein